MFGNPKQVDIKRTYVENSNGIFREKNWQINKKNKVFLENKIKVRVLSSSGSVLLKFHE